MEWNLEIKERREITCMEKRKECEYRRKIYYMNEKNKG